MNKLIFLVAAGLGFFIWTKYTESEQRRVAFEYQRSIASKEDNCTGKKFCVVVYVAPWCPACKSMAPQFRQALKKARSIPDYGVKMYVGAGKTEENEREAIDLGDGAYPDQDKSMMKKLNVQQFPSFFVLDKEQTVILSGNEAFQWMVEKIR